jgi:hypothetical protein
MHILKTQHLPNLAITQWRLILAHLARHLDSRIMFRQELLRRLPYGDSVIRGVEDLET